MSSIQTDLSVSPYFDDYSENKDFYKVLFQPSVSVQVRELNQLQTILQKQIERFGDNIFKRGTIISGCNITFHDNLQYVKIKDVETDSTPVNVNSYADYRIKNQLSTPLEATIINVSAGYESRDPDLNTLYVRYINHGYGVADTVGVATFSPGELLTVYNADKPIEKINITNQSSGFTSTDKVIITSAIAIQNSTGGTAFSNNFYIGDSITNGTATLNIVDVPDTTTMSDRVILKIKPTNQSLKDGDASVWSMYVGDNIVTTNTISSDTAKIVEVIGSSATAALNTTALGGVSGITMTNKGSGYSVLPTVSISSQQASLAQISIFGATPQNHLTNITIAANDKSPIGNSYAVSVGEGIIYQKGYFSRVDEHMTIVEKYKTASTPDQKVVGFTTTESIVTSDEDESLFDNATGQPNVTAPGANRLKLTPELITLNKSEADAMEDFFYIVEFSGGKPYLQNRQTVYNIIGNELSRRTYEESGNYVIDEFLLNTKSPSTLSTESTNFDIVIDPGKAYIGGNRVETVEYYESSVDKGTDSLSVSNANISLNYGNFVYVKNLGGMFRFNTGGSVSFYPTAGNYLNSVSGIAPSSAGLGTRMGGARIRSLVLSSGTAGTPDAIYKLYLFDIDMNSGKNFADVRSIYFNGTNKGIADTVLETGKTVLKDTNLSTLVYYAGFPAVKSSTQTTYIYRTIGYQFSWLAAGTVTFSVGDDTLPYTGTLSTTQSKDVIVTPMANAISAVATSGGITTLSTSKFVSGNSTSQFITNLRPGDFITTSSGPIGQVKNIANSTYLELVANSAIAVTANTYQIFYPAYVPIPLDRDGRSVSVDGTAKQMTINLGAITSLMDSNISVAYNVRSANVEPVTKTVNRNVFARIRLANNVNLDTGPWSVGVPDVFRLNSVTIGANDTFTVLEGSEVTQHFYIDHNQNEDYYGISYLYQKPTSSLNLTTSDSLLVNFDYFTHSGEGIKVPGGTTAGTRTYPIDDTISLQSSTTSINTAEIPEIFGVGGKHYDLRDQFDFRPVANSTVIPSSNVALAPINPPEIQSVKFSSADKKFPAPDSQLTTSIDYYQGRTDRVVIDEANRFYVIKGTPGSSAAPVAPSNALTINLLNIPPYPSYPFQLSSQTISFADTNIANEKYSTKRLNDYRITTPVDASDRALLQPRGYTMQDIGQLDRRISDLEYYTSLTLTETLAQKRSIPGFDGSDRFKFGFFVDGFEDYKFADLSNPGYNAAIVDGYLSPQLQEFNIEMEELSGSGSTLPYVESDFISQTRATDGPVGSIGSNTVSQTIATVLQSQRSTSRSDTGSVYEEFFYTMSSLPGPVEFYINARDNNIGAEIYQSASPNGPWTQILTSSAAQSITSNDVYVKRLSGLNGGRNIEHKGTLVQKSYPTGTSWGTFLEDQFKLSWTHDPDAGIYYKIRIYKGKNHGAQGKAGTYEYKMFYPSDSTINTYQRAPTRNYQFLYFGGMRTKNK